MYGGVMVQGRVADDGREDRRLAKANRLAVLAFGTGVLGVACYLAFIILLGQEWFATVCEGSWQEFFFRALRLVSVLSAPTALVLALISLWRPTERRLLAVLAIIAALFCATGVFTLGYGRDVC